MINCSSALVVLSIDLIMTLFFGFMGEFASLRGLNSRSLETILPAIAGRDRTKVPKVLRVAVMRSASLHGRQNQSQCSTRCDPTLYSLVICPAIDREAQWLLLRAFRELG
jgi:hypothetical protein